MALNEVVSMQEVNSSLLSSLLFLLFLERMRTRVHKDELTHGRHLALPLPPFFPLFSASSQASRMQKIDARWKPSSVFRQEYCLSFFFSPFSPPPTQTSVLGG